MQLLEAVSQVDLIKVLEIVGAPVIFTLLGGIWKGITNINVKLEHILLVNTEHSTILESHKAQIVDLWKRVTEVDNHLQNTDNNVVRITERTRDL